MDISVVIPTYNRVYRLLSTLKCLSFQDAGCEFEVIVCDDGSSDETPERVIGLSRSTKFPLLYLQQERKEARYAAVRNLGIKAASGNLIVLLDDDILVPPLFLRKHYLSHTHSNVVTVGYRYNLDLSLSDEKPYSIQPDVRDRHFAVYPEVSIPLWSVMETCNVSLERELLVRAGVFDETFVGWSAEDIELGYRLHKLGASLILDMSTYGWHQYDPDPINPFIRYFRGLKPDFMSQIKNLSRFREKYPEDAELQEILTAWIERLKTTEVKMLAGTYSQY